MKVGETYRFRYRLIDRIVSITGTVVSTPDMNDHGVVRVWEAGGNGFRFLDPKKVKSVKSPSSKKKRRKKK